jgi:hypothetical protein
MLLYLLNDKYFYFGCILLNIACKFKCYGPIAHDVTAPVTMHLKDKLAIYA